MLRPQQRKCYRVIKMWSPHQVAPIRKNTQVMSAPKKSFWTEWIGRELAQKQCYNAWLNTQICEPDEQLYITYITPETCRPKQSLMVNLKHTVTLRNKPEPRSPFSLTQSAKNHRNADNSILHSAISANDQLSSRGVLEANNWLVRLALNLKSDKPEDGATT